MEPPRETWFELGRDSSAAVQCAETLAECQYNLYVAPCLFAERDLRLRDRFALRLAVGLDDVALAGVPRACRAVPATTSPGFGSTGP
ncbi:MAG: hypothetical protein IPO81_27945 [Kouleothrix sp.]|nr:hypothetical protein [Kouleothrix sp.]